MWQDNHVGQFDVLRSVRLEWRNQECPAVQDNDRHKLPTWVNNPYHVTGDEKSITLKMNGSTIELWMDGSSSYDVQATDSTHTNAGKAGFRMYTPAASDSAANHINDWALMEADAGGQPYRKRLGGVGFAAHNAGVW